MSRLPAPAGRPRAGLSTRQRDFLLLNIFVLVQHGYHARARVLAETMHLLGDDSTEVFLARAVLRFLAAEWGDALAILDELDRIDPVERFGAYRLTGRQRMRRYLKTRCLYELNERGRVKDALEAYLRHGSEGEDDVEG